MKTERPPSAETYPISYAIFELARTHKAYAADLLREVHLYPGQELMLMMLWQHGEQTQSQVVERLELDPSTVAKSLRRLENAGLVTRRTSPADRRASIVSLTKKGAALERKVDRIWHELERATVDGLDELQRAHIRRTLQQLQANVARVVAERG